MIYFWSDTHFDHTGIIEHCHRTYPDVEAMNEDLVERWNDQVRPSDTIHLLGDFAFRRKDRDMGVLFARLNGHKHLTVGNHDERNPVVLKLPWESVHLLRVVKDSGRRVVCCHYPIESWPSAHHGALHAHGHCHGNLKRVVAHRFDVGADVFRFPVSIDMLFELAASQQFETVDHHGDM